MQKRGGRDLFIGFHTNSAARAPTFVHACAHIHERAQAHALHAHMQKMATGGEADGSQKFLSFFTTADSLSLSPGRMAQLCDKLCQR